MKLGFQNNACKFTKKHPLLKIIKENEVLLNYFQYKLILYKHNCK